MDVEGEHDDGGRMVGGEIDEVEHSDEFDVNVVDDDNDDCLMLLLTNCGCTPRW